MRTVYRNLAIRRSEVVCINPNSKGKLEFPMAAMIEEWHGVLNYLTGFENNEQDGRGVLSNSIMSNGERS